MIFRFPINFKSEVEETSLLSGRKFFYHVVLGIAYKGGDREGCYQSWNYIFKLFTVLPLRQIISKVILRKTWSRWTQSPKQPDG